MTKKHFTQLAKIISGITSKKQREATRDALADLCAQSNPKFNRSRFVEACEPPKRPSTKGKTSE